MSSIPANAPRMPDRYRRLRTVVLIATGVVAALSILSAVLVPVLLLAGGLARENRTSYESPVGILLGALLPAFIGILVLIALFIVNAVAFAGQLRRLEQWVSSIGYGSVNPRELWKRRPTPTSSGRWLLLLRDRDASGPVFGLVDASTTPPPA